MILRNLEVSKKEYINIAKMIVLILSQYCLGKTLHDWQNVEAKDKRDVKFIQVSQIAFTMNNKINKMLQAWEKLLKLKVDNKRKLLEKTEGAFWKSKTSHLSNFKSYRLTTL